MPDRNYDLLGANGVARQGDKHGFPVKTRKPSQNGGRVGAAGRVSYHSQVFTHRADRDALVAIYRAGGGRAWRPSRSPDSGEQHTRCLGILGGSNIRRNDKYRAMSTSKGKRRGVGPQPVALHFV